MQIDQLRMMELIHDVDLFPNQFLFHHVRHRDEFGGEYIAGGPLAATVHHAEGAGADLLEDVILIIDRRVLDIDRLWHVLAVHVEHKLIVVARLLVVASTYLFAGRVHLVLLLLELALDHALGGDQRRHFTRIGSAVDVLCGHPEVVLVPRAQTGHRERAEPGVASPDPSAHRMLAFLHHVVGDVAAAIPQRWLPADRQRVVADVIYLREPGRVRTIADLDLDDGRVLAEVVLGGDAIRAGVDAAAVADRQHSVTFLHLDGVMTTGLDHLSFAHPCDLRLRIASERYLDDDVHALVEEGGVAESRRHVQSGWRLDEELALGRFHAALISRATEILVRVLAEHVMDDEIMGVALGIDVVAATAHDLAGAFKPRNARFRRANDLALEVSVVVLDAVHLVK